MADSSILMDTLGIMPQLAEVFGLPMANHKTGSQVHSSASCQWAASIRDYMTCETITGRGDWMDKLLLDGCIFRRASCG
jgi:hypothetical protein